MNKEDVIKNQIKWLNDFLLKYENDICYIMISEIEDRILKLEEIIKEN